MRRIMNVVVSAAAVTVAGCASTGLSVREGPGRDVSSYLYAAQTDVGHVPTWPAQDAAAQPAQIIKPAAVAVAQIGEVAPSDEMLATLRGRPDLFRDVSGLSGLDSQDPGHRRGYAPGPKEVREHALQMQRVAANTGADYLLIYGGTLDTTERGTPLSLLDATVVGMFVVPSRVLSAEGKATGILIDVRSGRVVATATADASKSTLSTSFGKDGARIGQMRSLRDEVVEQLTGQFLDRFAKL